MPGCSLPEGGEMSSDAIRITKTANKKQRPKDKDLAFGTVFTDHMFVVDFQEEKGWYDPRVEPYAPLSPVGPYYPEGLAPTKIKVIDNYVRAVAGGLGEAKTSANYAASLYAAEEAKHEGFTQVLWLDGVHHKYLEEVGTSNIMLKIGDEVITPPLAGTILAGVTRDPALTLMRAGGLRVSERQITIDEVIAAAHKGALKEVWATGTAAVISPVGELTYKSERIVVNGGRIGELSQKLYDTIVGIQYGTAPDTHGWMLAV